MPLAHLHREDPDRNMARFYRVEVSPTLFGESCVLRTWGRIGSQGQTRFETCATVEAARDRALRLIRAKLRRGYVPAE